MDIKELQQKSDKELVELVQSLRERLRVLRFEASTDSVKNVREIRDAKKTVARVLTLQIASMTKTKNNARQLTGTVISAKMQKTVVVRVDRTVVHPKYKKRYTVSTKLKAHDEAGAYHEGDRVVIAETKPVSRDKRWRVVGKA